MVLTIDIGNSNIVYGFFKENQLVKVVRITTVRNQTLDECKSMILKMIAEHDVDLKAITGVAISSVVFSLTAVMRQAVAQCLSKNIVVVEAGIKTGLKIELDEPQELGADLVAGAVGALDKYPSPMIIIDLGTATTYSVINQKKAFVGGIIAPGIQLSLHALVKQVPHLPEVKLQTNGQVVGRNTVHAIQSGLILGAAASIDGMVERIEEQLKTPMTVIITGGLAPLVLPHCKTKLIHDEYLLLDGLNLIYQKNQ